MEVIIQGTVSALGFTDDEGNYCPEPDCYETLRDLIRYLRNDSNTFVARRIIGERNIIENDLIPLLKTKHEEEKMFDIILRLMVNIIQPTFVTYMGKKPEGLEQTKICFELEKNLCKAKYAFTDPYIFSIFKKKLEKYFINTEWDNRTEEDRLIMERITVLLRYVLSIPPSHDEKQSALESHSHDRIVLSFLTSNIQKVFIHIASESQEKDFHISVLEIIGYIIKHYNPDDIYSAGIKRTEEDKKKTEDELKKIFDVEQNKVLETKRKMLSSRHSRFAGTYWVHGVNTINKENQYFTAKPVLDVNKVSFLDDRKKKVRVAKNRRLNDTKEDVHLSSLELRLKIKALLEEILDNPFNKLMRNTKNQALDNQRSLTQRNADIHYYLVMRFVLRFARLQKQSPSKVYTCLGIETFHTLQQKIDQYLESAALQKKEGRIHGVRAQYAVTAYKELILFTQYVIDHGSQEEIEDAKATCKHILNVEEYRDMGITILKKIQPAAVSKTFLKELVLATHYYFRMLEKSVSSGDLTSVYKRQKRKKQKKAKKQVETKDVPSKSPCDFLSEEHLDITWAKMCETLSDIVMDHQPASDDQIAIQGTLSCTDEEHQQFAMLRIQRALREERAADAVGLYRMCREIWFAEEIFGAQNIAPEEEFTELRSVFYTNLEEVADNLIQVEQEAIERFGTSDVLNKQSDYDSEEEEEENDGFETKEVAFDFNSYVTRFAASDVIKWYIFLLTDFANNSIELNKALVKMLHRIAFDLKMHCRLFQLSLFRIFQKVNEKIMPLETAERKTNSFYELYTFGYHLLKRFFESFEKHGSKIAPEALFFKSSKESYEIEYGFGTFKESEEDKKMLWTEEMEDDLHKLHSEWRDMDERPEGMDLLDYIEGNLERPRTRVQIQKKLKNLGLETFGAKKTKGVDKTFPIIAVKQLIEEFNSLDNTDLDLVDWLRMQLESNGNGSYSRPKIIKQLAYLGVPYQKKKKALRRTKKTNVNDFVNDNDELSERFDSDDDISEPKSLRSEKDESFTNTQTENAESDKEEEDQEKAKTNTSQKRKLRIDSDDEMNNSEKENEKEDLTTFEKDKISQNLEDISQKSNKMHSNSIKRRRIISSSDEDSVGEEPTSQLQPDAAQLQPKARRAVIESDDED